MHFALRVGRDHRGRRGSSGRHNFAEFKKTVIDRARTRVLVFLNIGGTECPATLRSRMSSDMDAKAAAELRLRIATRSSASRSHIIAGPDWTPVERGVEAGTLANIPVMIDFGEFRPERPFQELVLKKLRPGDIYTHAFYAPVPMLDDNGKLLPYLFEARKRGVLFDVGHGGAAFEFRQAVPAVKQGFLPDSISTDVHSGSINAGMKDQLNVMSKFLNMGMSLEDVILPFDLESRADHSPRADRASVGRRDRGYCGAARGEGEVSLSSIRLARAWTARSGWSANYGGVRQGGVRSQRTNARPLGPARGNIRRWESRSGMAPEAARVRFRFPRRMICRRCRTRSRYRR